MSSEYESLRTLLTTTEDPAALRDAVNELDLCIMRGDLMIGILPPDSEELLLRGLQRLASIGGPEDQLAFVQRVFDEKAEDLAQDAVRVAESLKENDETGQVHLLCGYFAYRGFGRSEDNVESARNHQRAAELGHADAMFELAVYYTQGIGVEEDPEQAASWTRRAAEAGSARALYNLGTGQASQGKLEKAADFYQRAADRGHGRAAATLAVMLVNGDLPEDRERAQALIEESFESGFPVDEFFFSIGLDPEELGLDLEY